MATELRDWFVLFDADNALCVADASHRSAPLESAAQRSVVDSTGRQFLLRGPIDAERAARHGALATPRAAMPTSAHAPHCTLVDAAPRTRRDVASASRQALAAA